MSTAIRCVGTALAAVAFGLSLAGCGTPGAPQAPSLNLPERVTDLSAVRAGDTVTLSWTMPRRNTDKLLLSSNIDVVLCRREGMAPCTPVARLQLAPVISGSFQDTLPPPLASGAPRTLSYSVELKNRNGRSAGPSNSAVVLAGQAPPAVTGLAAGLRKSGVLLHWNAGPDTAIRLQRTLLSAAPVKKSDPLAKESEPPMQKLLVEQDSGRALDKTTTVGSTYQYQAQRITRVQVDGNSIELDGPLSAPIRVAVTDIFPPDAPTGLAAVAVPAEAGSTPAIDLNWQPNSESDLAGYIVYRHEEGNSWQRISGAQPVPAPAYHDAHVQPGHTYHYAVSAIDQSGHEGPHSPETQETVPQP